jgi:Skp family chaperone for outer membrane proteins
MNFKLALIIANVALLAAATLAQTAPPAKIAVIDTEAFGDPRGGIARIISTQKTLEAEFKPRQDELVALKAKYDQLKKEISTALRVDDQKALAAKSDQAEALETVMKRKRDDAQVAYARRSEGLMKPVYESIFPALEAFAKQRGIDVVIDESKFRGGLFVMNSSVDITQAFITDFNSKYPGL